MFLWCVLVVPVIQSSAVLRLVLGNSGFSWILNYSLGWWLSCSSGIHLLHQLLHWRIWVCWIWIVLLLESSVSLSSLRRAVPVLVISLFLWCDCNTVVGVTVLSRVVPCMFSDPQPAAVTDWVGQVLLPSGVLTLLVGLVMPSCPLGYFCIREVLCSSRVPSLILWIWIAGSWLFGPIVRRDRSL